MTLFVCYVAAVAIQQTRVDLRNWRTPVCRNRRVSKQNRDMREADVHAAHLGSVLALSPPDPINLGLDIPREITVFRRSNHIGDLLQISLCVAENEPDVRLLPVRVEPQVFADSSVHIRQPRLLISPLEVPIWMQTERANIADAEF